MTVTITSHKLSHALLRDFYLYRASQVYGLHIRFDKIYWQIHHLEIEDEVPINIFILTQHNYISLRETLIVIIYVKMDLNKVPQINRVK